MYQFLVTASQHLSWHHSLQHRIHQLEPVILQSPLEAHKQDFLYWQDWSWMHHLRNMRPRYLYHLLCGHRHFAQQHQALLLTLHLEYELACSLIDHL